MRSTIACRGIHRLTSPPLPRPYVQGFFAVILEQTVSSIVRVPAAMAIGRSLSAPLLAINLMLYIISACLAGWALNRNMGATVGLGGGPVGKFVVRI